MPGPHCPDCGTVLDGSVSIAGLCARCLLELALVESPLERAVADDPDVAPTLTYPGEGLTPGQILGSRYQIRSLLGRGGMGAVWRAFDLKLRVDVALKALHGHLLGEERALATLRQEVRTAREVVSPNVCRVFDLVEIDGQELVSMEYIDGTTLAAVLAERSPLALDEAREIAAQFLAGLEAIHAAGLVHRDMKPENVMLTRSGRAVVMDFGIAKGLAEARTGTIAGTPAYMAPEQARGETVDTRTDVFSAGVILAEMIAPGGARDPQSRQAVWRSVQHQPPEVAESPWQSVIRKAVSWQPEDRYPGAAALARALEEVTLRVAGAEDVTPYPGLASFTENDAEYFFGRELEVEAMWKKLRRPHLLGLIGPSGAGKSSFIRAGLLPVMPEGWRAVVTTPGNRPGAALAHALAEEVSGDPDTVRDLLRFDEPDVAVDLVARWRGRHAQALVIVDQFEELFTQNPPDVQEEFSSLLARLALEADVRVLLSMRDDFLGFCSQQESLAPVFSELTALKPLSGGALRRALVQPALKCGYRFEDDTLVDEMVAEVSDERGALPMLAFAAARLWEHRDREQGLLTREAYEHIGGVAGALAQHAEKTLEQIGTDRVPIVRELFRNLATAEGTRAARNREELLSVFRDRGHDPAQGHDTAGDRVPSRAGRVPAGEVLDALIDARLLTSFEVAGDTAAHRIEIIHESLLTAWPRLVRWQTQDTEGAQLRDELRQAAQMWEQHNRTEDLLWTGTAFREYQLWRERYAGGLTAVEEEFARAMTRHAERRKRRRRAALTATVVGLLVVLAIVTWSRFEAAAQARRAEAAGLLALAQLRIETDPSEALAYATASLELADTEAARILAVKTIWAGPPVIVLDSAENASVVVPAFSPDGRWLSAAGVNDEAVRVWHQDGSGPVVLSGHPVTPSRPIQTAWISESELITGHWTEDRARIWSFPAGELVREIDLGGPAWWGVGETRLLAQVIETDAETGHEFFHLRSWRLPDGDREELGTVDWTALGAQGSSFAPGENGWVYSKGSEVFYRPLPLQEGGRERIVGRHENRAVLRVLSIFSQRTLKNLEESGPPEGLWTMDGTTGEMRLWDPSASTLEPLRIVRARPELEKADWFMPGLGGRWLVDLENQRQGKALLWDTSSLPGADPRELKREGSWFYSQLDFHPRGDWVVASTANLAQLSFWPLRVPLPAVVRGYSTDVGKPVVFTPDGKWLATYWKQDRLRLWPLPGSGSREIRELEMGSSHTHTGLAIDPAGEQLFVTGYGAGLFLVPLDGTVPKRLEGFSETSVLQQGAFSPSGRFAAAATFRGSERPTLRVWDLETGGIKALDLPQTEMEVEPTRGLIESLAFVDETTLFTAGGLGVLRWDLEAGTFQRIDSVGPDRLASLWLSGDRRRLVMVEEDPMGGDECGPLVMHELATGQSRELATFRTCRGAAWMAFDDTLSVMAFGRWDGTLWVGRVGDEEAQLLVGHEGPVTGVAISPDGSWIASSGQDHTIRLWPMPDLDKPPLHTLPLDELLAKLETLTNIRVVRDPESPDGWQVTLDPFPGWAEVPTW